MLESIWSKSSQIAPTIAQIANIKDAVNSDSLKPVSYTHLDVYKRQTHSDSKKTQREGEASA